MKNKIISYLFFGIMWGNLITSIINAMGSSLLGNQWFNTMHFGYAINLLGGILVGIGWTMPALIYQSEKYSIGFKTLFHMTIGFAVYIPCAFLIGWIPLDKGGYIIVTALVMIFIFAAAVWFCFYLYYRNEAKRINQRIDMLKKK